jgi:hypothetical protein
MGDITQILAGERWRGWRIAMWGTAACLLASAMVVTGVAQGFAGAAGLATDPRGAVFSMAFALPWFLSAWLFRKGARER